MGFFDKLKSAANFITGGGADVNVATAGQVVNANEPIPVAVQVRVRDANIDIRNVYVKIQGVEYVKALDKDEYVEEDGRVDTEVEVVQNQVVTYSNEVIIEGAQTLEANQTYEFEGTIQLPSNVQASYYGVNARHEWSIYAGVDMMGNDPDSGWVRIDVVKF